MTTPVAHPDPTARFDAGTTPAGPVPVRRAITPAAAPEPRRASGASTAHAPRPAEVYSALDQVRRRAGLPAVDRSKYASKDKLRELIHRERSVELAGEGFRRMDIVRWKASDGKMLAEHVLNAPLERVVGTVDSRISDPTMRATIKVSATAAEKKVEDRSFKPHYRYLPIPQAVLDRNPNFGKNNPDY